MHQKQTRSTERNEIEFAQDKTFLGGTASAKPQKSIPEEPIVVVDNSYETENASVVAKVITREATVVFGNALRSQNAVVRVLLLRPGECNDSSVVIHSPLLDLQTSCILV
ncbi:hypothetical protein RB195_025166 [Necator americanus]|uniref:Uncharacterized protein n=1 Tax=Necator americanus TaxID=51031 RepID=A0ABR1ER54_NECAM